MIIILSFPARVRSKSLIKLFKRTRCIRPYYWHKIDGKAFMHSSPVKLGRPEGGRSDIDDRKRTKIVKPERKSPD